MQSFVFRMYGQTFQVEVDDGMLFIYDSTGMSPLDPEIWSAAESERAQLENTNVA